MSKEEIKEFDFEIHILIEAISRKEAIEEFKQMYGSYILDNNGWEINE